MTTDVDPRLREGVDASLRWYADVFEAHGVRSRVDRGLWWAAGQPPRWHSAVKTVRPGVGTDRVLRAAAPFERCTVADSFGDLALSRHGFDLLFEASWIHRPPPAGTGQLPRGWSVVRDEETFARWNVAHDTVDVLLPSLLGHPDFLFLAQEDEGDLVAGAVLHDPGGAAVGLSNTWATDAAAVDPGPLLACARALHGGRPLVGYAGGEELASLEGAGFVGLGPQLVWVR